MFKSRIGILAILLSACFAVLFGRLFQLQIVRCADYRALAGRDKRAKQLTAAPRAQILDRDRNVVAEDCPFFDVAVRLDRVNFKRVTIDDAKAARDPKVTPEIRKERAELLRKRLLAEPYVQNLAATLQLPPDELAGEFFRALDNVVRTPPWAAVGTPQIVARGVDEDTWLALRAVHEDAFRNSALVFSKKDMEKIPGLPEAPFPGLSCTVSMRRVYPLGEFLAHLLGGVGEWSEEDQVQLQQSGILLESPDARIKLWRKMRDELSERQASQAAQILPLDPREIDDVGQLYEVLVRLTPEQKMAASKLGLNTPLKWTERPPRMILTDAERLWLGVGMPLSASRNLLSNRITGEAGVERYYNNTLRGKHGLVIVEKNADAPARGGVVPASSTARTNLLNAPSDLDAGKPLVLTISMKWQQAVERALAAQASRGACVAIDCRNGEVLALASFPTFDPNVFTPPRNGAARQAQLKSLLEDVNKPLLNRAVSGEYPLGSIMKSLVAGAALERGVLTPDETFECPGFIKLGGQTFHCDGHHAHGTVNLYKGLRCSCNVMFHQVGARLGVEQLGIYGKLMLGERTGIDLPAESTGVYPDRAWRLKTFPNNPQARIWTTGNDYQLAIGQGQMNSTLLQAVVMIAAIGNGGNVVTPHVWLDSAEAKTVPLGISDRNLAHVRRGLEECVNIGTPGARGTAYNAFHSNGELPFRVAAKTSTAEHKKGAEPHAWFAGYAPAENPRIAFAIVLEETGHGGSHAAPVMYKILREVYLSNDSRAGNP